LTLLEAVLAKLREEFTARGKLPLFEHLKGFLGGRQGTVPYREIAAELEITEGALKVAVHRMRGRCRELLRDEIAHTVAQPEEIDDELKELFTAIGP